MKYNELLNNATELRKNSDWKNALEIFEKIIEFEEHSVWDEYFYALCLFKLNNFMDSLKICRNLYKKNKNFEPNRTLYAQNVARIVLIFANLKSVDMIKKALAGIKDLVSRGNKYIRYDVWFNKTIKLLSEHKQFEKAFVIVENADIKDFSAEVREINIDNKKIEIASELEVFLVEKVKIYFNLKKFTETIDLVNFSLTRIKKFHYSNQIWLKRLKAQSYEATNNLSEATKLYFEILKTKNEWFLNFELAKIIFKQNFTEASSFFLAKAVYDKQDFKFKIGLLEFLLRNKIKGFDLKNIANLICSVYVQNKRAMKIGLKNLILKYAPDCESVNKQTIYMRKIRTEAKNIFEPKPNTGEIFRKFNAFSGLLINGKNKFFFVSKKINVLVAEKVLYRLVWGYDFKKKKISKSAIVFEKI